MANINNDLLMLLILEVLLLALDNNSIISSNEKCTEFLFLFNVQFIFSVDAKICQHDVGV